MKTNYKSNLIHENHLHDHFSAWNPFTRWSVIFTIYMTLFYMKLIEIACIHGCLASKPVLWKFLWHTRSSLIEYIPSPGPKGPTDISCLSPCGGNLVLHVGWDGSENNWPSEGDHTHLIFLWLQVLLLLLQRTVCEILLERTVCKIHPSCKVCMRAGWWRPRNVQRGFPTNPLFYLIWLFT